VFHARHAVYVRVCVGVGGQLKLCECCERSLIGCLLSKAALRWSMMILVSLGLGCIIIGVVLALLQITSEAGTQHNADTSNNSLIHAVVLTGTFSSSALNSFYTVQFSSVQFSP